jgi:hypothetical protein
MKTPHVALAVGICGVTGNRVPHIPIQFILGTGLEDFAISVRNAIPKDEILGEVLRDIDAPVIRD